MSSLTNTAAPIQDAITDLAFYRCLVDSLTDVDYTGSGVGLERRRRRATRASNEMILTVNSEALVAYRAVAAQAAAEANQIQLDANLAAQGKAMWIMQKVANDGQRAMFMEPAHDQPAPADHQRAWDTPNNQGWDSWSSARDYWTAAPDAPDPWAPTPPPTLTSILADINHAWDVVKRTETEVGVIRNELRYA